MINATRVPDPTGFSADATINFVCDQVKTTRIRAGRGTIDAVEIIIARVQGALGSRVKSRSGRTTQRSTLPQRSSRGQIREYDVEIVMVKCVVDAAVTHVTEQDRQAIRELMLNAEIPLHHVIQSRSVFLPERALRIDVGGFGCESSFRPTLNRYRACFGRLQARPVSSVLRVEQQEYVIDAKRPAHSGFAVAERVPRKTYARLEIEPWHI